MHRGLGNPRSAPNTDLSYVAQKIEKAFKKYETALQKDGGAEILKPLPATRQKQLEKYFERRIAWAREHPDGQAIIAALYQYREAALAKAQEETIDHEFHKSFLAWLLGQGKQADHAKTPWGREPHALELPSVRRVLEQILEAVYVTKTYLMKLIFRAPQTLGEYAIYYKYILHCDDWIQKEDVWMFLDFPSLIEGAVLYEYEDGFVHSLYGGDAKRSEPMQGLNESPNKVRSGKVRDLLDCIHNTITAKEDPFEAFVKTQAEEKKIELNQQEVVAAARELKEDPAKKKAIELALEAQAKAANAALDARVKEEQRRAQDELLELQRKQVAATEALAKAQEEKLRRAEEEAKYIAARKAQVEEQEAQRKQIFADARKAEAEARQRSEEDKKRLDAAIQRARLAVEAAKRNQEQKPPPVQTPPPAVAPANVWMSISQFMAGPESPPMALPDPVAPPKSIPEPVHPPAEPNLPATPTKGTRPPPRRTKQRGRNIVPQPVQLPIEPETIGTAPTAEETVQRRTGLAVPPEVAAPITYQEPTSATIVQPQAEEQIVSPLVNVPVWMEPEQYQPINEVIEEMIVPFRESMRTWEEFQEQQRQWIGRAPEPLPIAEIVRPYVPEVQFHEEYLQQEQSTERPIRETIEPQIPRVQIPSVQEVQTQMQEQKHEKISEMEQVIQRQQEQITDLLQQVRGKLPDTLNDDQRREAVKFARERMEYEIAGQKRLLDHIKRIDEQRERPIQVTLPEKPEPLPAAEPRKARRPKQPVQPIAEVESEVPAVQLLPNEPLREPTETREEIEARMVAEEKVRRAKDNARMEAKEAALQAEARAFRAQQQEELERKRLAKEKEQEEVMAARRARKEEALKGEMFLMNQQPRPIARQYDIPQRARQDPLAGFESALAAKLEEAKKLTAFSEPQVTYKTYLEKLGQLKKKPTRVEASPIVIEPSPFTGLDFEHYTAKVAPIQEEAVPAKTLLKEVFSREKSFGGRKAALAKIRNQAKEKIQIQKRLPKSEDAPKSGQQKLQFTKEGLEEALRTVTPESKRYLLEFQKYTTERKERKQALPRSFKFSESLQKDPFKTTKSGEPLVSKQKVGRSKQKKSAKKREHSPVRLAGRRVAV